VKLALGKVELNAASLDELWAHVEQREVKSALMQAALALGAGVKTSGKWSSMIVDEMFENEPDYAPDAVGKAWEGPGKVGNSAYAFVNPSQNGQNSKQNGDNSHFPGQTMGNLSPKMQKAVQWLMEHPGDMALSGRQLESERYPGGERLSYRTWNDAKKHTTNGNHA